MLSFDQAADNMEALTKRFRSSDRNEAKTRLELIDTLFFECLGWSKHTDVDPEDEFDGEYADYVFKDTRLLMVVEAKREGTYFDVPAGKKESTRSLKHLLKSSPAISAACKQAMGYANERGIPLAVVANGHQLIAFIASRQDGIKPLEGKSLVFSSLEQMSDKFSELWQALSKAGVQSGFLISKLTREIDELVPPPLSNEISHYPGTKQRNDYQADLKIISELVLEDLIKDPQRETEYLKRCYCPSGALSQSSMESREMLRQRYALLSDATDPGPLATPATEDKGKPRKLLSEGIGRRPILLLGDVGVGKTSFIRNLIKVEAKEFFERALPLYLDLGSRVTLTANLQEAIIFTIRDQLKAAHNIDILKNEFVERIYRRDIADWESGIVKNIKDSNPQMFAEHRYLFVKAKQDNEVEHLKRSIIHISTEQLKPVVLFLDKLDQRSSDIQEQAYLIAHEMSTAWNMTVFMTIRPETFHASRRADVLSGYHPKAFTIAPPRVDSVIKRRLQYALELTSIDFSVGAGTARLSVLRSILSAFIYTLEKTEEITKCIDNLSNGDIRAALDIVRDFFGSGHVDTRKIAEIYELEGRYAIPLHEMVRAIVFGDYVHYDPNQSRLIANVFQISSSDSKEHFLIPILVTGVAGLRQSDSVEGGFVPLDRLAAYCQKLGFSPRQIDRAFARCYEKRLIQTGARRGPESADSIRPTTSGLYHVEVLIREFAYVDAMVIDTPVLDPAIRAEMRITDRLIERLARCGSFIRYLDTQWKASKLKATAFNWSQVSLDLRRQIDRITPHALGA